MYWVFLTILGVHDKLHLEPQRHPPVRVIDMG
jgi:hypothetical protein